MSEISYCGKRKSVDNTGVPVTFADQVNIKKLCVEDGTASDPALCIGEEDTGLFRIATPESLNATVNGTTQFSIASAGTTSNTTYYAPGDDDTDPVYSFTEGPTTGMSFHSVGVDSLIFIVGNSPKCRINATKFISNIPIEFNTASSAGSPQLITSGTTTGIFTDTGADNISLSIGGVSKFALTSDTCSIDTTVLADDGTEPLPAFAFISEPSTGIVKLATGRVALVSQGVCTAEYNGDRLQVGPELPITSTANRVFGVGSNSIFTAVLGAGSTTLGLEFSALNQSIHTIGMLEFRAVNIDTNGTDSGSIIKKFRASKILNNPATWNVTVLNEEIEGNNPTIDIDTVTDVTTTMTVNIAAGATSDASEQVCVHVSTFGQYFLSSHTFS